MMTIKGRANEVLRKVGPRANHGIGSSMLRATLLHVPGIGRHTEFRLWLSGISDWSHLRDTRFAMKPDAVSTIEASEEALRKSDVGYFFSRLPASDRWRVYEDFGERFAVVDVETTGLSIYDNLTLVGIEMGGKYQTFIRGSNLDEAVPLLESARGLITFNGTLFDVPFLRRTFPGIRLPSAHLDLRFLGRRAGLVGPLKQVEQAVGLVRDDGIRDITGYRASVLWSEFAHGDHSALELLVKYNAADTCNLRALCHIIVGKLHKRLAEVAAANARNYSLFSSPPTHFFPSHRSTFFQTRTPRIGAKLSTLIVNRSRIPIPKRSETGPAITLEVLLNSMSSPNSRIVGIDLSGSEARPSGWALLEKNLAVTRVLRITDEIIRETIACRPDLVSIDSPLTIPLGRDCTSDECTCRQFGISRQCERELRKRGISVYWCLVPSMQALTRRGMLIASELRRADIKVIESYPGAAQDIMRIPRKRASHVQLRAGLTSVGIRGIGPEDRITHDELDAVTSALVGSFYLAGLYESLGSEQEGYLIVPLLRANLAEIEKRLGLRSYDNTPLLVMLVGERAEEVAKLAFGQLPFKRVMSIAEARQAHDQGVNGLLVTPNPGLYQPLLHALGAKARCIAVQKGGATRVRRGSIFCDLIVDVEAPGWRGQLRSWLDELQ